MIIPTRHIQNLHMDSVNAVSYAWFIKLLGRKLVSRIRGVRLNQRLNVRCIFKKDRGIFKIFE